MPTKEEIQERAQLVRVHEANCHIQFPSDEEKNFRAAIMKKIGLAYGLKEMRSVTIDPPSKK